MGTNCIFSRHRYICLEDMPLTNRVQRPSFPKWTELFPLEFVAQARSARVINPSGKESCLTPIFNTIRIGIVIICNFMAE